MLHVSALAATDVGVQALLSQQDSQQRHLRIGADISRAPCLAAPAGRWVAAVAATIDASARCLIQTPA